MQVFLAWCYASQRLDDRYVGPPTDAAVDLLSRYDGFEFMVDGDHSGGAYGCCSTEDRASWGSLRNLQAQRYSIAAGMERGGMIGYEGRGDAWLVRPPFAAATAVVQAGYPVRAVTEVYVTPWDEVSWTGPEQSRASSLEPGRVIGFQLALREFDTVADEHEPVWSPDGRRIAYDNYMKCYSTAADGTDYAGHGQGRCPVWLADDSRLLYTIYWASGTSVLYDICLLDLGTGTRTNLTDILRKHGGVSTLLNDEPSWTPTDW